MERWAVTVEQMTQVDRIMTEEIGIDLLQMMENAGRHVAAKARTILRADVAGKHILVLAGSGNNGGGGLAAARHLANWGADVRVLLAKAAERLAGVPRKQASILHRMGIASAVWKPDLQSAHIWPQTNLILDALVGYGLKGAPREPVASLIR
ncbi:MAG: NAD(P)H-hydrate epimerase, partial [candidate division NC10 bacterium]|nr:NAD(P)H-hydrate epimerase [candidate division NC10 bacterium]